MSNLKPAKALELITDNFGTIACEKGKQKVVKRFTWRNQNRIQVQVINYGATITSIKFPNKRGIIDDVVLGFDDMHGYLNNPDYYFGTVGRFGNTIRNGTFLIDQEQHFLSQNMGKHHYNGGFDGFDKVLWSYHINSNKVTLSHLSDEGTEGYPGSMIVFITFELTTSNEFKIDIKAHCTETTIVNICNRCYFNLAGHSTGPDELTKHIVQINADCFLVEGDDLMPTGEIKSVQDTMYDFQVPISLNKIGEKLEGLRTNYCINRGTNQGNCFISRVTHLPSGRIVELYSNQFSVEFETGNCFPVKSELQIQSNAATKSPYLKNGAATFDLIDEIYNRVVDVMTEDKSQNYEEVLNFIRDLQKKCKNVHRTPSSDEIKHPASFIRRSKLYLDNTKDITLTPLQVKLVDKILTCINQNKEPTFLSNLKLALQQLVNNNKLPSKNSKMSSICKPEKPCDGKTECIITNKIVRGKKGARYTQNCAFYMQTQNYPDAMYTTTYQYINSGSSLTKRVNLVMYKFILFC